MPFVFFRKFYRELAERETRSIMLPEPTGGVPEGEYGFLEMYCDEPGCDCRRVLFTVIDRHHAGPLAVVNYGWEGFDFYRKWLKFGGDDLARDLQGPSLNLGSPQSKLAPAVVELVDEVLLADESYIERLKRHYGLVREAVDGKPRPHITRDLQARKRKLREFQARKSQKKRRR